MQCSLVEATRMTREVRGECFDLDPIALHHIIHGIRVAKAISDTKAGLVRFVCRRILTKSEQCVTDLTMYERQGEQAVPTAMTAMPQVLKNVACMAVGC